MTIYPQGLRTLTHKSHCNQVWHYQELNDTYIGTTYPNGTALTWPRPPPSICLPKTFLNQLSLHRNKTVGPFKEPTYPQYKIRIRASNLPNGISGFSYQSSETSVIQNAGRTMDGVFVAVVLAAVLDSNSGSSKKYFSGSFLRKQLSASLSANSSSVHMYGKFERDRTCRVAQFVDSQWCPKPSSVRNTIPEDPDNKCQWLPRDATIESYCGKYG